MKQEFNPGKQGPKTHVLLIGVGGYRYLKGGSDEKTQSPELKELGQLTTPMASVTAMYNKIIEYNTKDEWSKPLGSIEILLSPPPGSPAVLPGLAIENASIANIRKAYFSWKERCDEHEDNVAIFYYCGHGFQKKYHILLADDFGETPQSPWVGAFNFDNTRDAFYSCKAKTQISLVDACRQVTVEMLAKDLTVTPLEDPSLLNPEENVNHLTLKATASGKLAYGKKNTATYFTQAIISGLDGLVARQDENDDWVIETGGLATNIYSLLDMINPEQSFKQRCQIACGMPAGIIKRKTTPVARLEVSCNPEAALPLAGLSCAEDEDNTTNTFSRAPMGDTWVLNLKAAIYKVAANFQGGGFTNSMKKTTVLPPVKKIKLDC